MKIRRRGFLGALAGMFAVPLVAREEKQPEPEKIQSVGSTSDCTYDHLDVYFGEQRSSYRGLEAHLDDAVDGTMRWDS